MFTGRHGSNSIIANYFFIAEDVSIVLVSFVITEDVIGSSIVIIIAKVIILLGCIFIGHAEVFFRLASFIASFTIAEIFILLGCIRYVTIAKFLGSFAIAEVSSLCSMPSPRASYSAASLSSRPSSSSSLLSSSSCSSLNRAAKQAAAKCSRESNERKCDTKANYMWWDSMFPNLHGREGEDSCFIQCTVRSA